MSWKEIEKDLLERFGDDFSGWEWSRISRVRASLRPGALPAAARFLAESGRVRFISATALQTAAGAVDVWYHFDFYQTAQVLSIRVTAPQDDPVLASISDVWPNAGWSEQEAARAFGIRFRKDTGASRAGGRQKEKAG
ncbi:MAG: NADH-quinone oxidoreductase subunit C [bacterium]|nr:NADH-quinone oxidoreductase subunit C [bacterium]